MRLKLRYAFEAETELTHWPENMSEYNTLYAINMSLYPTYNDNIKPFLIPARNSFHLIAFYEKRHCLSLNPFFFLYLKQKVMISISTQHTFDVICYTPEGLHNF